MNLAQIILRLRSDALTAYELHERPRKLLIESVRYGVAAGLTQRQIFDAIGRSKPEVSRLLRLHERSALGRKLVSNRRPLLTLLSSAGGRNVRVFGSVSRGEDTPGSDIDLLVDFVTPASLFSLSALEAAAAAAIVGVKVDIVPCANLRANMVEKVRFEAVHL